MIDMRFDHIFADSWLMISLANSHAKQNAPGIINIISERITTNHKNIRFEEKLGFIKRKIKKK